MTTYHFERFGTKWSAEFSADERLEEEIDWDRPKSFRTFRNAGTDFTLKIRLNGEEVFVLSTSKPTDDKPVLFMKLIEGQDPLTVLLEDANRRKEVIDMSDPRPVEPDPNQPEDPNAPQPEQPGDEPR